MFVKNVVLPIVITPDVLLPIFKVVELAAILAVVVISELKMIGKLNVTPFENVTAPVTDNVLLNVVAPATDNVLINVTPPVTANVLVNADAPATDKVLPKVT